MLTVYTITYNEELMLPYFIRHYRTNFPGCRIIVYDNESTDATVKIALAAGCEVITYKTNNQLDDIKYLEIKNHCWQGSYSPDSKLAEWCIIADCDELCQITFDELEAEHDAGADIIRFQGYDMVNMLNKIDIPAITHGLTNDRYSKLYCFNARTIKQINYSPGCHEATPVAWQGEPEYSAKTYPSYHYRYLSPDYIDARYNQNRTRMCTNNRSKGMGSHYFQTRAQIDLDFARVRALAQQPIRQAMEYPSLKIFVAGFHPSHFSNKSVPQLPHLINCDLTQLQIGQYQNNALSEHRIFLSDAFENTPCDYTGLLSWRYAQKCRHLMPFNHLDKLYLDRNVVWAAWPAHNWYRQSCIDHPGIQKYLDELIIFANSYCLQDDMFGPFFSSEGTGLYANQIICHRDTYLAFIKFFRACFYFFHERYGFSYDFYVREQDRPRTPAVLYERFAALFFANQPNLIIKQIPTL